MEDKQWKGPRQVWSTLGTNIEVKQGSTMWHARHEDCIRVREEDEQELQREAEMMNQENDKQEEEEPILREDGLTLPAEEEPIVEQERNDEVETQEANEGVEC